MVKGEGGRGHTHTHAMTQQPDFLRAGATGAAEGAAGGGIFADTGGSLTGDALPLAAGAGTVGTSWLTTTTLGCAWSAGTGAGAASMFTTIAGAADASSGGRRKAAAAAATSAPTRRLRNFSPQPRGQQLQPGTALLMPWQLRQELHLTWPPNEPAERWEPSEGMEASCSAPCSTT